MSAPAIPIHELPIDPRRGTMSMSWFIVTEALLFVALFFSYFYLGAQARHWPMDPPPKLLLASIMLIVLLASSVVVVIAERLGEAGRIVAARVALLITIAMGVGFLLIQSFEYRERLRIVKPTTDAYGSIFFTITSIHGAHVLIGLGMLAYVALLPDLQGKRHLPHRPLHNAALYWHFVDALWIVIVALLYFLPHLSARTAT